MQVNGLFEKKLQIAFTDRPTRQYSRLFLLLLFLDLQRHKINALSKCITLENRRKTHVIDLTHLSRGLRFRGSKKRKKEQKYKAMTRRHPEGLVKGNR